MQTVNHLNHIVHAYRIAPWRIQRQWIGNALLAVVGLSMIAALYLYVTSQAAIAGREIQDLMAAMMATQHANADLQTQLATITSTSTMQKRAFELGFIPIETSDVEYIVVAGYVPPQPEILSIVPLPGLRAPSVPPEFNQSLIDWMDQQIRSPYRLGGFN